MSSRDERSPPKVKAACGAPSHCAARPCGLRRKMNLIACTSELSASKKCHISSVTDNNHLEKGVSCKIPKLGTTQRQIKSGAAWQACALLAALHQRHPEGQACAATTTRQRVRRSICGGRSRRLIRRPCLNARTRARAHDVRVARARGWQGGHGHGPLLSRCSSERECFSPSMRLGQWKYLRNTSESKTTGSEG